MKNAKWAVVVLLTLMFVASGVVMAEMVEGKVSGVDLAGNSLKVDKAGAEGATETVTIAVNDTTTYAGEVTALAEVIEGDEVKIEAEKDEASGNWVAKSVEVPSIAVEA